MQSTQITRDNRFARGTCAPRLSRISALQHTTTHCNTLQSIFFELLHRNALQHTATHCKSPLLNCCTATHCSTLQHTAAHCSTLQHTAAHCSTLQHTAAHCCNTMQRVILRALIGPLKITTSITTTQCNTVQHSTPHCTQPSRM